MSRKNIDNLNHIIGKIEGHMDSIWPCLKQIQKNIACIEGRLHRIEKSHDRWRAGATVLLSVGSITGSLLSYILTCIF